MQASQFVLLMFQFEALVLV